MPIQIRMHVNTDTPANTKWGMRGFANTTHGVQELQMQLQIQIQGKFKNKKLQIQIQIPKIKEGTGNVTYRENHPRL